MEKLKDTRCRIGIRLSNSWIWQYPNPLYLMRLRQVYQRKLQVFQVMLSTSSDDPDTFSAIDKMRELAQIHSMSTKLQALHRFPGT